MGHYSYSAKKKSPNFGYTDENGHHLYNEPEEIVIHHWGGDKATFGGSESWMCNPASEVSAHYIAEAAKVHRIVPPGEAAWHAGNRWHNLHSIGIECNPRCSDEDMKTVARLIANVWVKYEDDFPGLKSHKIIGHRDIVPTDCPGRWYDKLDELKEMAEKLYKEKTTPSKRKPEPMSIRVYDVRKGDCTDFSHTIECKLKFFGLLKKRITGNSVFDDASVSALKRYQKKSGLPVTGKVDEETARKLLS